MNKKNVLFLRNRGTKNIAVVLTDWRKVAVAMDGLRVEGTGDKSISSKSK